MNKCFLPIHVQHSLLPNILEKLTFGNEQWEKLQKPEIFV